MFWRGREKEIPQPATRLQNKASNLGAWVVLTGIIREETLFFPTRESKTMYRLVRTHTLLMIAKEKRVGTTVFGQRQKLR